MARRANDLGAQVTGNVVLISNTGAVVTKTNGFQYVGKGNITSVSPSAGQGTSLITIQGDSITGGGTRAIAVTIGGLAASIVGDATNSSYLVVRANAGPASASSPTGNVVVRCPVLPNDVGDYACGPVDPVQAVWPSIASRRSPV